MKWWAIYSETQHGFHECLSDSVVKIWMALTLFPRSRALDRSLNITCKWTQGIFIKPLCIKKTQAEYFSLIFAKDPALFYLTHFLHPISEVCLHNVEITGGHTRTISNQAYYKKSLERILTIFSLCSFLWYFLFPNSKHTNQSLQWVYL